MRRTRLPAALAAAVAAACAVAACGGPTDPHPATGRAAASAAPTGCASAPPVASLPPAPADWPVYHRTADRHGVDPAARSLQRAAPLWSVRLDGAMLAQPLVAQGRLIEATMHDSVYAFDAATGCQLWRTSLGTSFDVTT